jgi:hypothetical protein
MIIRNSISTDRLGRVGNVHTLVLYVLNIGRPPDDDDDDDDDNDE